MKKLTSLFLYVAFLSLAAMSGCEPTRPPLTSVPHDLPIVPPTFPHRIWVTSTDDNGNPGTLRYALLHAQRYDTIKFDTSVFPPSNPATIHVVDELLPQIKVDHLTLDASEAGVILDSGVSGEWQSGLQIVGASAVTIRGLQISHFSGPAIGISGNSHNNVIKGNRLTENKEGINLSTSNTSNNTITGNFIGIGVDNTGDPVRAGNLTRGITIYEGAYDNIVGPNNQIAYNGGCGIFIQNTDQNPDSYGNQLTQNSIHDNNGAGICLVDGANANIAAPYIFSVDLTQGLVSGTSCPDCNVEVFSTQDREEGEFYEGQTVAHGDGVFTFNNNGRFTFDTITATTTDANGNTSRFSGPAGLFNISDLTTLQVGNSNMASLLLARPSQLLPDNHIGTWFEDYGRYYDTDFVYRNGFKRIRIGSLAGSGQAWSTIINSDTLSNDVVDTISEYNENGVEIVLVLASGAGLPGYGANFQNDEDIDRYIDYVRFVVPTFQDRIHYYEIWNEPVYITVEDYANLIKEVVPEIRSLDGDAKIIIGGIHGTWACCYRGYGDYMRNRLETDYLNQLLRSGVVHMVDGISWHPFYDNIPGDPYYQEYPQIVQGIKELAASQGFRGEYFADEIMWITVDEELWDNGPPVSQQIAAKYYTRAITEHRGLGLNVTINTFFQVPFLAPIHNLCDTLAGAEPTDITLSLQTIEDANVRYYAFALPNGDRLIALWTNDEAVEEDYGVSATLKFPGSSPQRVIGIDVLNGFEQELITETQNGDLAIRDLLIKDYPIILRFVE